jgi:cysteine desulfurase
MSRIYLDHNATTRLHPLARQAMAPFLDEEYGNPSSVHQAGRRARDAVEQARDQVAALLSPNGGNGGNGGCAREEVIFCSGGTEGDNLAVRGAAEAARAADPRRTRVVASAVEHPAVSGALAALEARGFRIERLPADTCGRIDPDWLTRTLGTDVALVTVQWANHELGNVYPVAELAERAHAAGAWFHTDAVQAAGKLPLDVRAAGVDLATVSAHKLYGPKGAGALYARRGREPWPHTLGGHQERERRPGTENVAAIVGFGVAAEIAAREAGEWTACEAELRGRLEAGARAIGARTNGDLERRVANTTNLAFEGVEGQLLVEALDLEGVACSTGAACSSGSVEPSPVLLAIGQDPRRAREAVRFSLGRETTAAEIDRVLALLPRLVERVRSA